MPGRQISQSWRCGRAAGLLHVLLAKVQEGVCGMAPTSVGKQACARKGVKHMERRRMLPKVLVSMLRHTPTRFRVAQLL